MRGFFTMSIRPGIALAMVVAATTPSSSQNTGMFMNPFEERALGERAHPAMLQKLGGAYPDGRLTAYVVGISRRIAQSSAKHPDQFVFTVVNASSINAATMPGGFVYIHTGLLAWMNDEAELVALVGHEVGHAINRHAAKAQSRENVSRLGYKLGMLSPRFRARAAEVKEKLKLQNISYGQDQEYEADQVGFTADRKLSLDSMGAARMLYQLKRHEDYVSATYVSSGSEEPPYLQSHPQTGDRVRRAIQSAEQQGGTDADKGRNRLLDAINGMRLSFPGAKGASARYLRVVTVKPGETARTLARKVAMPNPLAYLLAMNGLDAESDVKAGMRIKIMSAT